MMRVMLVTFGVLGWSWYELSGGSEFEAGDRGVQILASVEAAPLGAARQPVPEVSRSKMTAGDLASVAPVAAPLPAPARRVEARPVVAVAQPVVPADPKKFAALLEAALSDEPESDARIMPAVASAGAVSAATPAVVDTTAAVSDDYRVVTGSRVNLRDGPATSYPVVTQLLQGEHVVVIDDTGDGWVKLRAVDGDNIGWMSDSFLVASN